MMAFLSTQSHKPVVFLNGLGVEVVFASSQEPVLLSLFSELIKLVMMMILTSCYPFPVALSIPG